MIQVSTSSLSIRIPRGIKPQMRNPNRSSVELLGEAFCRKGDDSDQFIFDPSTENDFTRKLSLYIFERTRHFLAVVPRKAFWVHDEGFQKHGFIGTGILLQQAANNRVPGFRS